MIGPQQLLAGFQVPPVVPRRLVVPAQRVQQRREVAHRVAGVGMFGAKDALLHVHCPVEQLLRFLVVTQAAEQDRQVVDWLRESGARQQGGSEYS